jgi:FKBP-type peptidyl-prolyl cis-trans isomerase SlyD
MQIGKDKVATFDFTVTSESGQMLDSSKDSGPFSYVHGIGYLIPGLESAMEGKTAGESFSVLIHPAQGYGERDESLLQIIPRSVFDEIKDLEVGHQIQIEDQNGTRIVAVSKIEDDHVTLDGNHPLAGVTLNFDIDVVDVRDATKEELEHSCVGGHDDCGCGCHEDCQDDCCN